jgi:hypothetical protein
MSSPKTNLEKQKRRHWGPLVGIAIALAVATVLFLWLMGYIADTETPEPGTEPVIEETEPGAGIPGEGAPATPTTPEADNQVIEVEPEPGD